MEELLAFLTPLLEAYGGQLGFLVQLVSIVGTLRLLFKPVMSIIDVVVKLTPSESDDDLADRIEQNKVVKSVLYVLDWLASIKLKK